MIRVETNIDTLKKDMFSIQDQAIRYSLRTALNKALGKAYDFTSEDLQVRYSMKKGKNKGKGYRDNAFKNRIRSAQGDIFSRKATIVASTELISLIHKVVGKKKPRSQRRVHPTKRRPVYVKLKEKQQLHNRFIATEPKYGGTQVFFRGIRKGGSKEKFWKQSIPHVFSIFVKHNEMSHKIVEVSEEEFEQVFYSEFDKHLAKIAKANRRRG